VGFGTVGQYTSEGTGHGFWPLSLPAQTFRLVKPFLEKEQFTGSLKLLCKLGASHHTSISRGAVLLSRGKTALFDVTLQT